MADGSVIPVPLGGEVGEDARVEAAHPVVRVRASDAVRNVLVRLLGRGRRSGHRRHRTSRLAALAPQQPRWVLALALLASAAMTGAVLGSSSPAKAADPVTFTVG